MDIQNAIIEGTVIDIGDRGMLTVWLYLDYGGCSQGFGGYALYLPESWTHHEMNSPAGHFLFRCMQIADVGKWSEMKGKTIRVKAEHSGVKAIGHIVKDDWFNPSDDFKAKE